MKRTKKILVGLLATLSALFGALGLAACGSSNIEQDSDLGSYSQGLEYKSVKHFLSEETYIVNGIGECTDKDIVIPSRYNGKKVTAIANSAFRNCNSLTSITVPNSITSIGKMAFYWCENLSSITIGDGVTSIGDEAFYWCNNITSVKAPMVILDHIQQSNLETAVMTSGESVRASAFGGCRKLRSVSLPDSVKFIGEEAFRDCKSLKSITIPQNVTSIASETFSGCESLGNISIPDGVTSIGKYAFKGCYGLTAINIPDRAN